MLSAQSTRPVNGTRRFSSVRRFITVRRSREAEASERDESKEGHPGRLRCAQLRPLIEGVAWLGDPMTLRVRVPAAEVRTCPALERAGWRWETDPAERHVSASVTPGDVLVIDHRGGDPYAGPHAWTSLPTAGWPLTQLWAEVRSYADGSWTPSTAFTGDPGQTICSGWIHVSEDSGSW